MMITDVQTCLLPWSSPFLWDWGKSHFTDLWFHWLTQIQPTNQLTQQLLVGMITVLFHLCWFSMSIPLPAQVVTNQSIEKFPSSLCIDVPSVRYPESPLEYITNFWTCALLCYFQLKFWAKPPSPLLQFGTNPLFMFFNNVHVLLTWFPTPWTPIQDHIMGYYLLVVFSSQAEKVNRIMIYKVQTQSCFI